MPPKFARALLAVAALLIVSGPPPLRTDPTGRAVDAALVNPLALDAAGLLEVGVWLLSGGIAAVLAIQHWQRRTSFFPSILGERPVRWYAFFALIAVLSYLYSPRPLYTLFFASKIVVALMVIGLLAWYVKSRPTPLLLNLLFLAFGIQAAAIAVLSIVEPALVSTEARLTGGPLFGDYGESALLFGLFCITIILFSESRGSRLLAGTGYVGSWVLLVQSETRSAMAAGGLFLLIMATAHPRARRHVPVLALAMVLSALLVSPASVQDAVSVVTREGEGLETLSGRTVAFEYLVDQWQESPWLGYGFAAGNRVFLVDFRAASGLNIGAGHDAISTVLVDLGLLGGVVLLIVVLSTWRRLLELRRLVNKSTSQWVSVHQLICLMAWVTIQCTVGSSIAAPHAVFVVVLIGSWSLTKRGAPSEPLEQRTRASRGTTPALETGVMR